MPCSDFIFDNDIDHGLPSFNDETLDSITLETTGNLTHVTLASPEATDVYDAFVNNAAPSVTASVAGNQLAEGDEGQFVANLESGAHTLEWMASDVQGNTATLDQAILIYPSISFQSAEQSIGETQLAQV